MATNELDRLYVRDDNHQYQVDYFMDPLTDDVVQLDYEGAPLKVRVKKVKLEKEGGEGGVEIKDHVKSPMPGTVVKVFV